MKSTIFAVLLLIGIHSYAQRPIAVENGKFFETQGNKMLYGGAKEKQHFKINNLELEPKQFHYGIGRERFPALITPKFESVSEADNHWEDTDRFLVAYKDDQVRAYSVKDLTRHEVVNDVIGGEPIFAAYCILADLGAIYKRTYADKVFTFAVSGYTYFDPKVWEGLDGFILWDRETESLWWPLIDRAVSGPLKGVGLRKLDQVYWKDTQWKDVKENFSNAKVLITNQDFERPDSWRKYDDVSKIVEKFVN